MNALSFCVSLYANSSLAHYKQLGQAYLAFRYRQQIIHLREKNIAGPTERPKSASFFGSQGSDLRFSMKMMFAGGLRNSAAACLNCQLLYRKGAKLCLNQPCICGKQRTFSKPLDSRHVLVYTCVLSVVNTSVDSKRVKAQNNTSAFQKGGN